MKKQQWIALLLALVLAFGFTACGAKTESTKPAQTAAPVSGVEKSEAPAAPRMFTDDCGRTMELPAEISRIVPSGPLSQIVLYAIAPEKLAGLADYLDDEAKGIIPDFCFELPYFGQLYGTADLNVEELAKAAPQLIIDIGEAKKSVVEDMDTLQNQTMIPSVHIEASLGTMGEAFRRLGTLLGKEETGEALAQFCEKTYSRTLAIMDRVGEENKVNALYITGQEGLNVLARGSYHAELIDLLVNNLAVVENPSGKGTGNAVTMEQLLVWNPDVIIFAPGSIFDDVHGRDTWDSMKAIADGAYIETPGVPHNWMGQPPSVQRYLGMIWLPAVLYPEYCDYDVKAEIMEYYRLFYGCTLSREQYEMLTGNAFLK